MKYFQKFSVTGTGPFPFDMLRYDACYPSDSDNAMALGETENRTIWLSRTVDLARNQPTGPRWASFGWKLNEVQTRKN